MNRRAATCVLASLALVAGCSGASSEPSDSITVFAASSLRDPLGAIGTDLTRTDPGLTIRSSFAGSSELVTQLTEGAHADVLLTADETTMDRAVEAGLVEGDPTVFATNTMAIVVAKGNPSGISGVADLVAPDLDVVVCAPQVPCGAATGRVTEAAGVALRPASEESKVTDVLGKVASGEADAGIVYVTDAASFDVDPVPIPDAHNTTTRYLVAVLADSDTPDEAQRYVDAVLADSATDGHLHEAGFRAP